MAISELSVWKLAGTQQTEAVCAIGGLHLSVWTRTNSRECWFAIILKNDYMVCLYIWGIKELKFHHKFQTEQVIHLKLHF